jgi:hypothetical protein
MAVAITGVPVAVPQWAENLFRPPVRAYQKVARSTRVPGPAGTVVDRTTSRLMGLNSRAREVARYRKKTNALAVSAKFAAGRL